MKTRAKRRCSRGSCSVPSSPVSFASRAGIVGQAEVAIAAAIEPSPAESPARGASSEAPSAKTAPSRLLSLDVFRGITIAGMILVNNPGSWNAIYWPLAHAEWHGWTPTDLIFPFFLFIVGVSMALSFSGRAKRGNSRGALMKHAAIRSILIFLVGFSMAAIPYFRFGTIRIPGVLQRIAVCYLFASLAYLYVPKRGRVALVCLLLFGYWALMALVPVPGYGAGRLDVEGNLAAYLDRQLLLGHLWKPTWDPEGPLSTLPAIATAILGTFLGDFFLRRRSPQEAVRHMLVWGIGGLAAGQIWNFAFPINKNLWTSSYVVFTAGFALILLAICYWLVDVKGWRGWAAPFLWYGMNPLALFVFSGMLAKMMGIWRVTTAAGESVAVKTYIYRDFFEPLGEAKIASLLFALAYVAFWLAIAWVLYRRKIFIKI